VRATIVPFELGHAPGAAQVIGAVFREYGATFDLSGFDADLTDIPRHYLASGGCFVVLEDSGRVVGTAAAVPHSGATCEVKRVYLLAEYRGRGHGRALLEHVLGWAEGGGYLVALAWSDTRFTIAHRVYERLGFVRFGERTLDDLDRSREYGFAKRLMPGAGAWPLAR
jgi:GNAT superfamily N-acetyltransferase